MTKNDIVFRYLDDKWKIDEEMCYNRWKETKRIEIRCGAKSDADDAWDEDGNILSFSLILF